jgi:hypothetical protein
VIKVTPLELLDDTFAPPRKKKFFILLMIYNINKSMDQNTANQATDPSSQMNDLKNNPREYLSPEIKELFESQYRKE